MKKRRITHVISDSNIGGAGVLLRSVAASLNDEFDIEVLLPKGAGICSMLREGGIKLYELPMQSDTSFNPRDTAAFRRLFSRHQTDVVHTHGALSARLGARLAGIGSCLSTRHCAIPLPNLSKKGYLKRKVYNYCTDLTVSTAEYATENLVYEGIPRDRILTIKNGVARRRRIDEAERSRLLAELNIPHGAVVIGSCARLETVKGQDLIISALPRLIAAGFDVYLLLIGTGRAREALERLCARLGILGRVKFTGFIDDPTSYQNLFQINVNASRGTETSCLATSECMSLGIPTVASDFGGNTEMVFPGKNGLIFKSDNVFSLASELLKLIYDRHLYERLSAGAEEVYESCFSIERMTAQYAQLYRSL